MEKDGLRRGRFRREILPSRGWRDLGGTADYQGSSVDFGRESKMFTIFFFGLTGVLPSLCK